MKKLFIKILTYYKYRNLKFCTIDENSEFRDLSSTFTYTGNISIGRDVQIGPRATFDGAGGIIIGNGSIIAPEVKIFRVRTTLIKILRPFLLTTYCLPHQSPLAGTCGLEAM